MLLSFCATSMRCSLHMATQPLRAHGASIFGCKSGGGAPIQSRAADHCFVVVDRCPFDRGATHGAPTPVTIVGSRHVLQQARPCVRCAACVTDTTSGALRLEDCGSRLAAPASRRHGRVTNHPAHHAVAQSKNDAAASRLRQRLCACCWPGRSAPLCWAPVAHGLDADRLPKLASLGYSPNDPPLPSRTTIEYGRSLDSHLSCSYGRGPPQLRGLTILGPNHGWIRPQHDIS